MLISHRYRYIFIAVPKTATTSIITALNEYGEVETVRPKHKTAMEAYQELPEEIWNTYYKFSFVRNPFDWVASWYFYRQRENFKNNKNRHHTYTGDISFSDFVRNDKEWPNTQLEFLANDSGNILVDFIGRYENLDSDFNYICKKINIPCIKLPSLNMAGKKFKPSELYDDELIALVEERDGEIIKKFDYKPDYKVNTRKGRSVFEYVCQESKRFVKNIIRS